MEFWDETLATLAWLEWLVFGRGTILFCGLVLEPLGVVDLSRLGDVPAAE